MIICMTGIDGCGKGTQIELLRKYLEKNGKETHLSKAYGSAEKESFSHFIEYWDQLSILFLFQALHAQQRIEAESALNEGKIVIADRWDESYLSYHSQFGILAQDHNLREHLNQIAFNCIVPDLTFLLQVTIATARKRMISRGKDFFDRLPDEYHQKMQEGYLSLGRERDWVVLDGEMEAIKIHNEIISRINGLIERR